MIKRISAVALAMSLLSPSPAAAQALRASALRAEVFPLSVAPRAGALPAAFAPSLTTLSPALPVPSLALAAVPAAVPAPAASALPVAALPQAAAFAGALAEAKTPSEAVLAKGFDGLEAAAPVAADVTPALTPLPVDPVSYRMSLGRAASYGAMAAATAVPGIQHVAAMSNGAAAALIVGGIAGLLLAVRWIESSKTVQFYLAKRRWVTANFKKWKEATDEEKRLVEEEAERIIAANKAGRWPGNRKTKNEPLSIRPVEKIDAAPAAELPPARPAAPAAKKPAGPKVITFADVAGNEEAKAELVKVVEYIKDPSRFNALGAKGYKGVMLFGPPGTGKTLIARAVAGEAGATWHETSGSAFVNTYVGKGPSNVREAFAKARGDGKKPGVLFIDEIDAVGKKRGNGDGNEEYENTLNALLTEMSAPHNANVVVIAATNRPDLLDPALTRGRRLGLKVPVGLPDIDGREAILKLHAANMPLEEGVTLRRFAELTPRLSGADLEEIVNDAAMLAAERKGTSVSEKDFRRAVERATIGHERKLVMTDFEKRVVAHHESGHALVAWLVPNGDQIRKITIVPHGLQALGLVQTLEADEKYMYSKPWLEDRIAIALGGRVAEKMATGMTFSGAQNDFEQATRMARMMVMKFGMSEAVGHVSYDMDGERPNVGRAMSEKQRELIDSEVRRIIDEQTKRVESLLAEHKAHLDGMAGELMAKETLRENDLERLLPARPNK